MSTSSCISLWLQSPSPEDGGGWTWCWERCPVGATIRTRVFVQGCNMRITRSRRTSEPTSEPTQE
jgi:hypothetical protein